MTQERPQLSSRADRLEQAHVLEAANGSSSLRLRAHTVTGRPGGSAASTRSASRGFRPLRSSRSSVSRARGGEQFVQLEPRRERVREPPAVPEDRQRADGLQVAHLEPPAPEPHVGLDEGDAELARPPETCQVVAGAMGDDEGHPSRLAAGTVMRECTTQRAKRTTTQAADGVEHVVVRRHDDRSGHRGRAERSRAPAASDVRVAPQTANPTRRFQPKCRLGKAAY